MRTRLASVVRTIPLAISTCIVYFHTAWLEFHISVPHIRMEILHVQTHSHLGAHNVEPGVTEPANCPWKILVCLSIMHATSHSDLCVGRISCMHNFGTMTFPKPARDRSRRPKIPEIFSSEDASPGIYIHRYYPVLDVLSLVGMCLGPYWDLLMEHRQ